MTPSGKLQVGDLIKGMVDNYVVLSVGKGRDDYSIVAFSQNRDKPIILTEIPYYMQNKVIKFVKRKPTNVAWAKGYARATLLPEV